MRMIQEPAKPSHTPGPWIYDASDLTGRMNIRKNHANGDTRILAYSWQDQNGEANAKLMAASPTMLDALQAVADSIEGSDSLLARQVRDAIRKATE